MSKSPEAASSPALGAKRQRTDLPVRFEPQGPLAVQPSQGLLEMRRTGTMCDLKLVAESGSGAAIPVHRVVLAALSSTLLERMLATSEPEMRLKCSHEAADLLVRWMYGEVADEESFNPSTVDVNEEVLRVAVELGLTGLVELCCGRLAVGLVAANVVHRIVLCDELRLPRLRAALRAALLQDQDTLFAVSQDASLLTFPALMGELLAALASGALAAGAR